MNRRRFLETAVSLLAGARALADEETGPVEDLKKFKITQVTGFLHVCPRPKLVGKNSHLDVHGRETRENVLRIATGQGVEGVGIGNVTPETARLLLGHSLSEYWKPGLGVVSPIDRADHALFDLAGNALNLPAWKLMGGRGQEWVPVYDGSIYFNDLLPEFQSRGVARLLEEVDESLKDGHRAFKIKVGRGFKWMDKEAGFRRDVEVVTSIRKHVGRDVKLMVDSNNGFDLATTIRWLDAIGDDLFFVEEMFPEEVRQDLELKKHIKNKGWKTLVADGESAREVSHFDAYVQEEALDVLQPDIRVFGLTRQWELSRKIMANPGIRLAPHNWGSFLALYMQLVLGRGISNFLIAEQDRSSSDLFDTSAFTFREGKIRVPDLPGCGVRLREDVFKHKYQQQAWVVRS
jgi:L-alanine-DL-glutamate epimerase-like enolase superfamily enzyme